MERRGKLNRFIYITLIIFLCITILVSCDQNNHKADYATEEPFLIASETYAGEIEVGAVETSYSTYISIDVDGNVKLYSEGYSDEDAPIVEMTINQSEVEHVQKLIEEASFWKLDENISDNDSNDGYKEMITVQWENDEKTVGGLNPLDEGFNELKDYVFHHFIDQDQRHEWEEEIEQYILEVDPDVH